MRILSESRRAYAGGSILLLLCWLSQLLHGVTDAILRPKQQQEQQDLLQSSWGMEEEEDGRCLAKAVESTTAAAADRVEVQLSIDGVVYDVSWPHPGDEGAGQEEGGSAPTARQAAVAAAAQVCAAADVDDGVCRTIELELIRRADAIVPAAGMHVLPQEQQQGLAHPDAFSLDGLGEEPSCRLGDWLSEAVVAGDGQWGRYRVHADAYPLRRRLQWFNNASHCLFSPPAGPVPVWRPPVCDSFAAANRNTSAADCSQAGGLEALAQVVTAPWTARGIHAGDINALLDNTPAGDGLIIVQVIDGQVYVSDAKTGQSDADKWWRQRRRNAFVSLLLKVLEEDGSGWEGEGAAGAHHGPRLPLPDLEIVCIPHDGVGSELGEVADDGDGSCRRRSLLSPTCAPAASCRGLADAYPGYGSAHTGDPLPAAGGVGCLHSFSLPVPVWGGRTFVEQDDGGVADDSLEGWESLTRLLRQNRALHPWDGRVPKAVFRGESKRGCWEGTPGSGITHPRGPACGRRRLRHLGLGTPWGRRLLEVGLSPMPMLGQERFKHALYVEGNLGWADRAKLMLFSGSLLLMQETFCREYYTLLLEPWVHYIPVHYTFDNLRAVLEWASSPPNSAQVLQMVANMNAFADHVLSMQGLTAYLRAVMGHYGRAMAYPVHRREGAVPAAEYLSAH